METGAHLLAVQTMRRDADSCREKEEDCKREIDELDSKLESVNEKVCFIPYFIGQPCFLIGCVALDCPL